MGLEVMLFGRVGFPWGLNAKVTITALGSVGMRVRLPAGHERKTSIRRIPPMVIISKLITIRYCIIPVWNKGSTP